MKNERTGKQAATIAGRVLKSLEGYDKRDTDYIGWIPPGKSVIHYLPLNLGELKTLAASALTQSPDKSKAKAKSKRK